MTRPRSEQICLETTRFYHCTTRCVRRGFLCGYDDYTQTDYEHRRAWLEQRLQQVASVYCIKLCSYAIMNNHYHTVLYVDKEQAIALTDREVLERWKLLYRLPATVKRAYENDTLTKSEQRFVADKINEWRIRLYGIGWFMKEVNLHIAKKANQEDECTGHFWEGRYRSQSLLDDKGVLSAMVYDELNPIRAGMADMPEESLYTSLVARLKNQNLPCLHPFQDAAITSDEAHIPFNFSDYVELVDWTGRQVRADKRGVIDSTLPPILQRLNLAPADWLAVTTSIERPGATMVGSKQKVKSTCTKLGRQRSSGYHLPN